MDAKIKILVAGDVRGKFKQLFLRADSINKKAGPFEILLCVGDFFGTVEQNDELIAYKNGCRQIPVPTYILGPNTKSQQQFYADIDDGEICSNLTYLGKRGLYTLSSGVKIVYLSGVEAPAADASDEHHFSKEDIAAIRNSCLACKSSASDYKGVDILLTSQWPHGMVAENARRVELPDDFYRISPEEIKREQQLRSEAIESAQVLKTKAMREREEQRNLRMYRFALVRVKFPNGLYIQGTFHVYEKISDIYEFVQSCLIDETLEFNLVATSDGKLTEEDMDKTLYDLRLIPNILLLFTVPGETAADVNYLKEELLMLVQTL